MPKTIVIRPAVLALLSAAAVFPARADNARPPPPFGDPVFTQQGGANIYKAVCQGCHMPDAKGAVGAGAYPALAGNPRLEEAGYPVGIVIHGQKAMPAFGVYFTDTQIADVVNYVRSSFGNHYPDKVKPGDVKAER